MFQFRAFPSHAYLIQRVILEYCSSVLPHSVISGSMLICSSPKLFAACHDLHRLLMPRHSPCALYSLTYVEENCAPLRPPLRAEHPLRSVSFSSSIQTRLRWALLGELGNGAFFVFLVLYQELCRLNRIVKQNCIYPFKSSTIIV